MPPPSGRRAMRAVIADVFARHMAGENPENVELMFRRAYSAGFTQRPDPDGDGRFLGARDRLLGHPRQGARPAGPRALGRADARPAAQLHLSLPRAGPGPGGVLRRPGRLGRMRRAHGRAGLHRGQVRPRRRLYHLRRPPAGVRRPRPRRRRSAAAIRAAVGDRADLLFGTHGQFTPSGAIRLARRIAPYDPLWFEEPVPPDLPLDLARVAAQSPVPIAAGERLTTKAEFATLLRAGGVGDPAAEPRPGRRAAGGAQDRGDGRGLRRPGRPASLRRADRLGGGRSSSRCRSRTSCCSRRSAPAAASMPSC